VKTIEFLSFLHSLDVRIWAEGEHLRCNAPDGVLTPALQGELKKRKEEILTLLEAGAQERCSRISPIEPVERNGPLPLSFAQQRLWFLHQLEPESQAYNSASTLRLQGPVDVAALRQALQALVDRHETLRTSFPTADGQPSQVIADSLDLPWNQEDLRVGPEAEREGIAQGRIQSLVRQPFDLATGPLIRVHLLQLDDKDFVLLIILHHIISDAWSLGIVSRELAALYDAFVEQRPSPLAPLPIQYADFSHWQRLLLAGEVLEQQLGYWHQHLSGLAPIELPTDRPRPPRQTYEGARHVLYIEPALTDAVNALSQKSGVSLAITLLAVFQSLLSRYTGQTDIAVGSPIANRNRREIEGLVGFFVNSLVMRTDLSGDPSFVEVLGRVQQVSLAAYDHQDLPFEQLVEELQPDRDPSRNPLFQIMFAVQNAPAAAFSLSGVTVRPYVREVTTTRLDLEANVWEHDNGLQVFWVYNTDLFDETTIERFSRHFRQVLEAVVREPRQRLSQISLLSHDERQQILIDWNATDAPLPRAACIHDLVGDQAGRTPDAVALACGEDALSYAELDTRANQLARYLQERYDVGPEVCVGVCMARSADMIVAILGILKAGGAYVPLDPNYPTVRLAYILEDAGVGVLLTQERLVAELPDSQARVVCIDTAPACRSTGPVSAPESRATASNLAYLIYTSGSTGQPKGVAIEHRSAVALVQWAKGWFREEELRGVLASTSMCFDLSVFEMFVPLGAGGSVILAESVLDLRELPNAKDVTLINTVPSGIAALLRQPGLPDSVRTVNLAGEPLKPQLVKQIEEAGQVERVYDLYGPSEDTTYSTGTLRTGDGPEVIGRPIANTQAYVLDGSLQPVPIGVPGDLYLGGAGLARGYYVPGSEGPPGKGPRLPDRARRDRDGPGSTGRDQGRGGRGL
jgi:amino acid adenylation domain-containing protein